MITSTNKWKTDVKPKSASITKVNLEDTDIDKINDWRNRQPDRLGFSEAVIRLIELGLRKELQ